MSAASGWNAKVRATWSSAAAGWERWEAYHLHYLSGVNAVLLRELQLAAGQRVLDVACGPGEPTLEIARWIGPRGRVVGLDIAAPMLAVARRRARLLAVRNARFVRGDLVADTRALGAFDRVTSRFGLMFVPDVAVGLARLRTALRPGGRAAFAVWGTPRRNAFFNLLVDQARPLLTELPDPETTPHPFRLARRGRLAQLMTATGFRDVRVHAVPMAATYPDPETWYEATVQTSATMQVVSARLDARGRARFRVRLLRAVSRYRSGSVIRLPGLAWVVAGTR